MNNMFYILSKSLAQATGKDEVLCRGVMRMTITSSINDLRQVTDPNKFMNYTSEMTYQDWKKIIEGPALSNLLTKSGMRETSALIAKLMQTLIEQQSLFTMGAR